MLFMILWIINFVVALLTIAHTEKASGDIGIGGIIVISAINAYIITWIIDAIIG